MSFKIPGMDTYFGGKGGSGTYQQIINIIPPHDCLVIPFVGNCGIARNIKSAHKTIINDIDPQIVLLWMKFIKDNYPPEGDFIVANEKALAFLDSPVVLDSLETVIYLDPPYPMDSRKSNHKYNFEMTDNDHLELLEAIKHFKNARVLISTYDNPIYANALKGWSKISFTSQTRNGVATETVYFNYEMPDKLHDYQYFGKDYRKREQYKLKRGRLLEKLDKMPQIERNFYLEALREVYFKKK